MLVALATNRGNVQSDLIELGKGQRMSPKDVKNETIALLIKCAVNRFAWAFAYQPLSGNQHDVGPHQLRCLASMRLLARQHLHLAAVFGSASEANSSMPATRAAKAGASMAMACAMCGGRLSLQSWFRRRPDEPAETAMSCTECPLLGNRCAELASGAELLRGGAAQLEMERAAATASLDVSRGLPLNDHIGANHTEACAALHSANAGLLQRAFSSSLTATFSSLAKFCALLQRMNLSNSQQHHLSKALQTHTLAPLLDAPLPSSLPPGAGMDKRVSRAARCALQATHEVFTSRLQCKVCLLPSRSGNLLMSVDGQMVELDGAYLQRLRARQLFGGEAFVLIAGLFAACLHCGLLPSDADRGRSLLATVECPVCWPRQPPVGP